MIYPVHETDKHHTKWSGGAKQTCNRQRIVSRSKEPEVVEQCQGKLKKLSPTLSCSHYSRRSLEKPNCKKRIKTSFHPQRQESTVSIGIARKLATCEDLKKDVHLENNEAPIKSISCSRSKSEIAGRECFPGPLDMDETGSNQEDESKQTKHVHGVSQRSHVFNKQHIIAHPSLMVVAQTSVKADMTISNFRKYLKELVEDQCWLADKIIQLQNELNVIVKEMEEVKGRGSLKGSTPGSEMMTPAQCRQGGRGSLSSSNNCMPNFKLCLFDDNKNSNSASSLKIFEVSRSVASNEVSSSDNNTDCSRNPAFITRQHPRQQEKSDTLSCPTDISPVIGASKLCSSTEKPASAVFRFVQYVFLLLLVVLQLIVQFVTMGT